MAEKMLRKSSEDGYLEEFKEVDICVLERTVDYFTQHAKYFVDAEVPDRILSYSSNEGLKIMN